MTLDAGQEALVDLVSRCELRDVIAYEHSASREDAEEADISPETSLEAKVRTDDSLFEARFRMLYRDAECSALTDIGLVYEVAGETPDSDVVPAFLEQVAVMSAFPYLREGIGSSVARLGLHPPVLGMIRRGEVSFGQQGTDEHGDQQATEGQ